MVNERVCIYAKNISILLGKSYKHGVRLLRTIKHAYGKDIKQYVTLEKYSEYIGIAIEIVRERCLKW